MARFLQPTSVASILRLNHFLDAVPSIEKAALKIYGYPEYAFTVDTLKGTQQDDLNDLAAKIVASQPTNQPIRAVTIFGHADVALKISPGKEREQTEMEVSRDRAEAEMEALKDAIRKRKGGDKVLGRVHMRAKGMGSNFRDVIPARTDEEMKRNRRVEFFTTELIFPPPQPEPPPKPETPDPGTRWTAQILSGNVASEGLSPVSVMTVTLSIEITDVLRNQKAKFAVVAIGNSLPGVSLGPLGGSPNSSAVLTKGDPKPFSTSRPTDLDGFGGTRVAILVDPGAAISVLSTPSLMRINFEGMESDRGLFVKPSPVGLPAGTRFDTLPQAGAGGVVHGALIRAR